MNKKFSTLVATVLVVGSVSAQNWLEPAVPSTTVQAAYRTFATKSAPSNPNVNPVLDPSTTGRTDLLINGGRWVKDVKFIDDELLYQLEINDTNTAYPDVLIQERNYETGEVYLRSVNKDGAPLNASLWKVVYSKADGVSGGYFTYINKETGLALTFDHSVINNGTVSELRAGIEAWSWYTVNKVNATPFGFQKVYSYLHDQNSDQVMYLAYEDALPVATNAGTLRTELNTKGFKLAVTDGKLVKAKVELSAVAGDKLGNLTDVLEFKPVIAAPFYMTAQEFNTRMDADDKTNGESFKFNLTPAGLVGSDAFNGDFTAETNVYGLTDASFAANNDAALEVITNRFDLNFKIGNQYLMTALKRYQEATMKPSVSPSVEFTKALLVPATSSAYLKARYNFRATYFPSNDSLLIEPLNAAVQDDGEYNAKTSWAASKCCNEFFVNDYTKANTLINNETFDFTVEGINYASKTVSITAADIPGAANKAITVARDGRNEFKVKSTIDRPFAYLTRSTVPTGLYFIQLANHAERQRAAGMWIVKNMAGEMMYDTEAQNQRYDLMPATMWTVKQLGCNIMEVGAAKAKYVEIQNREYPGVVFTGQLYSEDGATYRFINRSNFNTGRYMAGYDSRTGMFIDNFLQVADQLVFTAVTDAVAKTSTHGYKKFSADELNTGIENNYNIKWNNFLNDNLFVQSGKDSKSYIEEAANPTFYEIAEATMPTNGGVVTNQFGSVIDGYGQLTRNAYIIKVKDRNLIDNNQLYIASVKAADGRYYYQAVKKNELNNVDKRLAHFYLKADQVRLNNAVITDTCYVLVDINDPSSTALATGNGWRKVAVEAGQNMGVLRDNNLNDEPNDVSDAFYTVGQIRKQYIDLEADYKMSMNNAIKIYRKSGNAVEYLFEDQSDHKNVESVQAISTRLGYLGIEGKGVDNVAAALYVDKVLNSYEFMPQYLFAVDVDSVADGYVCSDVNRKHGYWNSKAAADAADETHVEAYNGYVAGRYLINLTDSVESSTSMMDDADKYKWNSYTRLAFVEAVHQMDGTVENLYILKPGHKLEELITITDNTKDDHKVIDPAKLATLTTKHVIGAAHSNYTFALRKLNDKDAEDATASEGFLLESNKAGSSEVGSFVGSWVKIHNGIPVLAQITTGAGDHEGDVTSIDEVINQSQIFFFGETTETPTDNGTVDAPATISVIAGNGQITIKNAEGKTVAINNILGQTIAKTRITSDNATVSVPAGIVVVSVEGEAAVKAIVK